MNDYQSDIYRIKKIKDVSRTMEIYKNKQTTLYGIILIRINDYSNIIEEIWLRIKITVKLKKKGLTKRRSTRSKKKKNRKFESFIVPSSEKNFTNI